jgi:hypothetical protein
MSQDEFEPLICRSYTFARRYPLVIGKIGGWAPIWGPATPAQYGVAIASALLLIATRKFWAYLPGPLEMVVFVTVPFGLAWYLRAAKIEGRAPLRALAGLYALLTSPPKGERGGKPVIDRRPARLEGGWILISDLPPASTE